MTFLLPPTPAGACHHHPISCKPQNTAGDSEALTSTTVCAVTILSQLAMWRLLPKVAKDTTGS